MSNELQVSYGIAAKTLYAVVRNQTSGFVWDTTANNFVAFGSGSWSNYAISLTEQGVTGYYMGNMPSAMPAGVHAVEAREQLTGSPVQTDPRVGSFDYHWNGSVVVPLSNLATSGQVGTFLPMRQARSQMIQNFLFDLVSAADHVTPFTSGTISGQISKDGGIFGALQSGAFTEVGLGFYSLQAFTSGDFGCNTAAVVFTGANASGGVSDPRRFSFILQRVSGYQ